MQKPESLVLITMPAAQRPTYLPKITNQEVIITSLLYFLPLIYCLSVYSSIYLSVITTPSSYSSSYYYYLSMPQSSSSSSLPCLADGGGDDATVARANRRLNIAPVSSTSSSSLGDGGTCPLLLLLPCGNEGGWEWYYRWWGW